MPEGTPFAQTESAMNAVIAGAYEAVGGESSDLYRSLSVTVGATLSSGFNAKGTTVNSKNASAVLELAPAGERRRSAAEIERDWRDAVGRVPGVKSLIFNSAGLSGGNDISFNLSHSDSDKLIPIVESLTTAMAEIDGVFEVESSADTGKRQLDFSLKPAGAAAGLTVNDLAKLLRQTFFGEEVQRIQRGSEEVIVYVRLPEAERRSLADLVDLRVPLPSGGDATLLNVATIEETRSFSSISRADGRRIISVTADVDEAVTTPNAANALIRSSILADLRRADPGLRLAAAGQARDQTEDLTALANGLMVSIMIMYVLLASVLRSYVQPLIILAAIPFGAVGAILGHMLFGYDVSFLSMFGVVALSGIVVNDSVILIDYFNNLQKNITKDDIRRSHNGRTKTVQTHYSDNIDNLYRIIANDC